MNQLTTNKCNNGHDLTEDNVRLNRRHNGTVVKICRVCDSERAKKLRFQVNVLPQSTAKDSIVNSYKEPLRKNVGGYGYLGAITYDKTQYFTQCHVCGYFYRHLGKHARQAHGLSSDEYKEEFGLMKKTSLFAPNTRYEYIRAFDEKPQHEKDRLIKALTAISKKNLLETGNAAGDADRSKQKKSLEWFNKNGTCPDQIIDKIVKLQAELNKTPSIGEFNKRYGRGFSHAAQYHFGSWRNAIVVAGFTPLPQGDRYNKEALIKLMRDFKQRYGREPFSSDLGDSLPHGRCFRRHFGKWSIAKKEAFNE